MSLYCAVCDQPVHGDMNHVRVGADFKRIDDRDDKMGYLFHTSCWHRETGHWEERNGQNHKLEMVYEQVEIGDGWEPEQDE